MAFRELVTERQVGFGLGSIPWSAIDRFARRYNIADIDEFERFARLIRAAEQAQDQAVPSKD